jgi:tetratricopeptide (TPR) repeat protein/transcriptional regulator with XRE-family HTH domain
MHGVGHGMSCRFDDSQDQRFGEVLRQLRVDANLTQEGLAQRAGIAARTISDLERGKATVPHPGTALRLARALELTGQAGARFTAAARRRVTAGKPGDDRGGMRMLPRDIASFTGRDAELEDVLGLADAAAARPGSVPGIYAISGMAGAGKTAFAVHAAHRLAERFPDGQVFAVLHGHTPGRPPADPSDALASLLLAVGYQLTQIPQDTESRAALWRHHLAGLRMLIVLDDAASTGQLLPLLPGTAGCLVLVTSRRHLTALDDACAISLDTLRPEDATGLVARLAGRPDVVRDDGAVANIARLCGYLPLAIGMLARQLHHHHAWTAGELAAELASAKNRLELLTAENVSVAAAFDLSYRDLSHSQQRLFRRLGLHFGSDIDAYAAAALDGTAVAVARRHLKLLYDHCLLTEPVSGRYGIHDLIKEYARAMSASDDAQAELELSTERLTDYYQHTATVASVLLARQPRARSGSAPAPPAAVPCLPDSEQALRWMRAERANMLACLDHATRTGQHARVVALTTAIAALLRHDGPWADAITRHGIAIKAARLLGDQAGEAAALTELGFVRRHTSDFANAAQAMQEALDIYQDLGDRLGQANALSALGVVRRQQSDYARAARSLQQALTIYRDLGECLGQANTLTALGVVRRVTGDYPGAVQAQAQAVAIFSDLGNQLGRANALTELADAHRVTGHYATAIPMLEEALSIFTDLGNQLGQANVLTRLGTVVRSTGDYAGAVGRLNQALAIFRKLGDRSAQATVLNGLGTVCLPGGAVSQAKTYYMLALELARDTASSWDEANALTGLGRCAHATGDIGEAEQFLRAALEIFDQIGAAESTEVSAELEVLTLEIAAETSPGPGSGSSQGRTRR